jgi:CPA1 family monovalent cation:H+ antiporter
MPIETTLILLFIVAAAVAVLARRLRLPYTVALVLTGLALGQLHVFEPLHLTQELLFAVFLPGLLFEAAFHLDIGEVGRDRALILTLAVPGVVAAILTTAAILAPFAGLLPLAEAFTWRHALVFGALVAASDPIAVVALFRSLGAPSRLTAVLEGESLLNDGTAIVFFGLILGVVSGASVSVAGILLEFVRVVGLGAGTGFVVGLVVSLLIRRIDDPMIEITLTTIAAYGAFAGAERLHGSGVIATVVAGLVCGNYGARTGMSPTTRLAVETFWEYVAFALNSIIFLLIGFEVRLSQMFASWPFIVAAFTAVLVARAAVVVAASTLAARGPRAIPRAWQVLLSWGGLRGGLSMVLALGLPLTLSNRGLLIDATFGVVLLSILVQGLSMAPLLRRLGVGRPREARTAYDRTQGELHVVRGALGELEHLADSGQADLDTLDTLRLEYQARQRTLREQVDRLRADHDDLPREDLRRARRHLLMLEKTRALDASRQGLLGSEAYERLVEEIDGRLLAMDHPDAEASGG